MSSCYVTAHFECEDRFTVVCVTAEYHYVVQSFKNKVLLGRHVHLPIRRNAVTTEFALTATDAVLYQLTLGLKYIKLKLCTQRWFVKLCSKSSVMNYIFSLQLFHAEVQVHSCHLLTLRIVRL